MTFLIASFVWVILALVFALVMEIRVVDGVGFLFWLFFWWFVVPSVFAEEFYLWLCHHLKSRRKK